MLTTTLLILLSLMYGVSGLYATLIIVNYYDKPSIFGKAMIFIFWPLFMFTIIEGYENGHM